MENLMLLSNNAASDLLKPDRWLQVLRSSRPGNYDRARCEEFVVTLPKVVAQLVEDVYGLDKHSRSESTSSEAFQGRWKKLGYQRIRSLGELGISSVGATGAGRGIWYAVFQKTESSPYARAPQLVIAVRGTRVWSWQDVESNLRIIAQFLDADERYHHLREVAERVVQKFGHHQVWITGHSLGAALALLVGKDLAKKGTPVEAHLFNPPFEFATFAWVGNSPALRRLEDKCKLLLQAVYTMLRLFLPELNTRMVAIKDKAESTAKWWPHLYLNEGDFINQGYVTYFMDKMSASGFQAKVRKCVDHHSLVSLLSLITPWVSHPDHRLLAAHVTTARGFGWDMGRSHSLSQWYEEPPWMSGEEVDKVRFGRHLIQRRYGMRRAHNAQTDTITYEQTATSTGVQLVWSTASGGLGTSETKQVVFLFSNAADARLALERWPSKLRGRDINERCIRDARFLFRMHKFEKGAVTFYAYAVKRKGSDFQRELEWVQMIQVLQRMQHFRDWISQVTRQHVH